jgi:hypothetical protein
VLPPEATVLRAAFERLAQSEGLRIPLHELEFVEPLHGCTVVAISARRDIGVRPAPRPPSFEWILSLGSWHNAEALAGPFCGRPAEGTRFQFLNPGRGAEVILSTTRSW